MTHNLLGKCMGNTPIPQVMHYISRPDNFRKKSSNRASCSKQLVLVPGLQWQYGTTNVT